MTLRSFLGKMFLRPGSRPKSHWKDYISQLAWERLGECLDELEEVARGWLLTLLWMDLISPSSEVLISEFRGNLRLQMRKDVMSM